MEWAQYNTGPNSKWAVMFNLSKLWGSLQIKGTGLWSDVHLDHLSSWFEKIKDLSPWFLAEKLDYFQNNLYLCSDIVEFKFSIMPRKPRESSGTGIYHVMLRGINQTLLSLYSSWEIRNQLLFPDSFHWQISVSAICFSLSGRLPAYSQPHEIWAKPVIVCPAFRDSLRFGVSW